MSVTAARDRRLGVLDSTTTNGIDYVEVDADQIHLNVHFLNQVQVRGTLASATPPVTIAGGEVVPSVALQPVDEATDWSADADGRPVLALTARSAGDFSQYTLTISTVTPPGGAPVLDPFFASVRFSFKANCPSTLDCAAPADATPAASEPPAPPIDYLAKDFDAFGRVLSGFSALRYPDWVERSEADLGMVLMEALAAVADDLSYYQDRVAAESSLDTATQPVSILRHARLVDYEPAPAITATALLHLELNPDPSSVVPPVDGLVCYATGPDGQNIPFQVVAGAAKAPLDRRWNEYQATSGGLVPNLAPYWWDDSQRVLPAGSTQLWVIGSGLGFQGGQRLVLHTDGPTSADLPVREPLSLIGPVDAQGQLTGNESADYLFPGPSGPLAVTRLDFSPPLAADHDLSISRLFGNLVDAAQGVVVTESFAIPPYAPTTAARPGPAHVVVRAGHDGTIDYRYTLASTAQSTGNLAWLANDGGAAAVPVVGDAVVPASPDITLTSTTPGDSTGTVTSWLWRRSLTDVVGAELSAPVFTLTPERYSPIAVLAAAASTGTAVRPVTCFDYDGGDATTIRFGDGTFGAIPAPGTVFEARYRVGLGAVGNVPADAVSAVAPGHPAASAITACSNPFRARGGADAETAQQVRDRAPQAFRALPLRAVRPEDYVQAAQTLPWVQQAGSVVRWTGSWPVAFTTANPADSEQPTAGELAELTELLDRRRLAGRAGHVLGPRYASIDLRITVLAEQRAFRGDVQAAVLDLLRPGTRGVGGVGFFDHSRWLFGLPLDSSRLQAAIQAAPGVAGVLEVSYRRRGVQPGFTTLPDRLTLAADQVLRVDDDPSRPDAGSLAITVEGGK